MYLTVNPVEYHGPHLSLHNDELVSQGMLRDLHERLVRDNDWPLLVAAGLEVGVEPAPGPGSRPISYRVVRDLVKKACDALAELGAQKIIILTFHGNPFHAIAIEAGIEAMNRRGLSAVAPFNIVVEQLLTYDPTDFVPAVAHIEDEVERADLLAKLDQDFHAGFFETSMTLHYAPESVDQSYVELPPCPQFSAHRGVMALANAARALGRNRLSAELRFAAIGMSWLALDPFPGYTGRPHLASGDAGAFFANAAIDRYEASVRAVFAGEGRSPKPIMPWLRPVGTFVG